jgi:hypothetical protein
MKTLPLAGLAMVLLGAAQEPGIDLDLKNTKNMLAARLEGTWKPRPDLNRRLTGDESRAGELVVVFDAKAVPEPVLRKFGARAKVKLTVYAIGRITLRSQERPFLLTALHGNPHLLWFRERNGDPFGDAESFNLMIAPGKAATEDLLLVGGDFNNQPFSAYGRAK